MAYITWDPPSIGRLIQFHVGFQQQKLPCHLSKNGSFFFMISARDVPQICNFNNFMKQNKPQYPSISIPCLIRFPRKFPRKLDLSDHQLRSDEIRSLGPAGPLGPSPAMAHGAPRLFTHGRSHGNRADHCRDLGLHRGDPVPGDQMRGAGSMAHGYPIATLVEELGDIFLNL